MDSRIVPGLVLAAALAAVATLLAPHAPILGAPVLAIIGGTVIRSTIDLPSFMRPGIDYASRSVLQGAIVVSGFGVSLVTVARTGIGTLPVTLATMAIVLALAPLVARVFRVQGSARVLIACGTAICGASAIAAVSKVIEPEERESALAIATIFAYNIAAVLLFPIAGKALGMSQTQFGVWAGTAINDTSSVVAAGFAYGHAAGLEATVVKLTRALLIIPMVGILMAWRASRGGAAQTPVPWITIVPWFILWFLCAALVNSLGFVPANWRAEIVAVATFAISTALAGIGLQTSIGQLARAGVRPLAYGGCLWAIVTFSSLAVQRLTGL